jgi:hypothetical protein
MCFILNCFFYLLPIRERNLLGNWQLTCEVTRYHGNRVVTHSLTHKGKRIQLCVCICVCVCVCIYNFCIAIDKDFRAQRIESAFLLHKNLVHCACWYGYFILFFVKTTPYMQILWALRLLEIIWKLFISVVFDLQTVSHYVIHQFMVCQRIKSSRGYIQCCITCRHQIKSWKCLNFTCLVMFGSKPYVTFKKLHNYKLYCYMYFKDVKVSVTNVASASRVKAFSKLLFFTTGDWEIRLSCDL